MGFRGAIFDVDGVLVDSPHERAWREALQELMENEWSDIRGQTNYSPERFTPAIYQAVMAGKPRMAGAQSALDYFGVPDAASRAELYGERKQEKVVALIEAGQFHAFTDALRFVLAVKGQGIPMAVASSGVQAAKAGNMAALGVARMHDQQLLNDAGADLVVTSLDDADISALAEGRLQKASMA